jgi:hypothetical protein
MEFKEVVVGLDTKLHYIFVIFTIPAGEVGVAFNPFSNCRVVDSLTGHTIMTSVNPVEYSEGIHIKLPWVSVDRFSVKTQRLYYECDF